MRVEQAIYGEVRGGHALRLATDSGRISPELTSRLDLPDTAPPGASWSPFVSGFPHKDWYVLARTFSDPAATRTGMVLSHAVIAPLEEVAATADLRPLLALFITTPAMPERLDATEITTSAEHPPSSRDLLATADALTTAGTGPVIRIGHEGFEDVVVSLWFYLWPELRRGFSFRLSFGPHDLVDLPKPSLVCTPHSLAARWTGHRIIGSAEPTHISRTAAILSGGGDAQAVLGFAREIGARLDNLDDLRLLDRAYDLETASTNTFDECVAILRLTNRLSPDPAVGTEGKARLVAALARRLPAATARDVLLLRNLRTEGLPRPETIWAAVRAWAEQYRFSQVEDEPLWSAIDDAAAPTAAIPEWREAFLTGIVRAACAQSSDFPAAFWRWADARPATLFALADHLPTDRDLEGRVAKMVPSDLPQAAGKVAIDVALSKHWLLLHGVAVGATLAPHEAIRRQLSVDNAHSNMEGVRAALHRATPLESLAIAAEVAEERVLQIAAEEVARNPQLLRQADVHAASSQDVWRRALTINADAWQGPADPQQALYAILTDVIDGRFVSVALVGALSSSPVADLSDYSRRAEVWALVGGTTLDNLLNATASGWLKRCKSTGVPPYAPDRELQSALLAGEALDQELRDPNLDVGAATRIVSALSGYDESRFLRWFSNSATSGRPIRKEDAEALGRLMLERRWQRVLDETIRRVRAGRRDLKPALCMCTSMVGVYYRWSLDLAPVSREEKWLLLEEVAADLYPRGPDESDLWDRAGGRRADLQAWGTGRDRWRDAIRKLRRGKRPRTAQLLTEMERDFPANDKLRELARDLDLRGGNR